MNDLLATVDTFSVTLTGGFAIYGVLCILYVTGYGFYELCKPLWKKRSKNENTPESESE